MAHYAKVLNGIVTHVIVADSEFIETFVDDSPGKWIQTSYNTYGGKHSGGGTPLRKNYAGVDYTYDKARDAFIPPQPYASWTLDEDTCLWEPPVAEPTDKLHKWDEDNKKWVEVK